MTMNGTGKVEEIVIKLSPQMAVKISDVAYSLGVVQQLMQRIIEQHRSLCSFQQSQMDSVLTVLCEQEGRTLPARYEYKLDLEHMSLSIRERQPEEIGLQFAPPPE